MKEIPMDQIRDIPRQIAVAYADLYIDMRDTVKLASDIQNYADECARMALSNKLSRRGIPDEFYVIVNSVSAELHGIYEDENKCMDDCKQINTLGSYSIMTLQEHLDNLLTWFNAGQNDIE